MFEGVPTRDVYYGQEVANAMREHEANEGGVRKIPTVLVMRWV